MSRINLLLPLCVLCLLNTACSSSSPAPVDCQQKPVLIKTSKHEQPLIKPADNKRQSSASHSISKLATVEEIKINLLESFPVQVLIEVKGSLPSACYRAGKIHKTRDANHFSVTINLQTLQTYLPCPETPVPFATTVPLDVQGLEAGGYCVDVNGITDSFELSADN